MVRGARPGSVTSEVAVKVVLGMLKGKIEAHLISEALIIMWSKGAECYTGELLVVYVINVWDLISYCLTQFLYWDLPCTRHVIIGVHIGHDLKKS